MTCLPPSGREFKPNLTPYLTKSTVLFSAASCRLKSTMAPRGLSPETCRAAMSAGAVAIDEREGGRETSRPSPRDTTARSSENITNRFNVSHLQNQSKQ